MKKKINVLTLCAMLFALCSSAQAQQPTKVPRVGFLTGAPLSSQSARNEAFRQGLRGLGYWRGKTLSLSGDLMREKWIAFRCSLPSWYA